MFHANTELLGDVRTLRARLTHHLNVCDCPAAAASLKILKQEGLGAQPRTQSVKLPGYRGNGLEGAFKGAVARFSSGVTARLPRAGGAGEKGAFQRRPTLFVFVAGSRRNARVHARQRVVVLTCSLL